MKSSNKHSVVLRTLLMALLLSTTTIFAATNVDSLRNAALINKSTLLSYNGTLTLPDSATIYSWITGICATPHRRMGTPEGHIAEAWVTAKFRELGLTDVHEDSIPIPVWTAQTWKLTVDGNDVPCSFLLNSGFTAASGVTAPMAFVGQGHTTDYSGVAAGAIAVADADIPLPAKPDTSGIYFLSGPQTMPAIAYDLAYPGNMLGDFISWLDGVDAYKQAVAAKAAGFIMILKGYQSKYSSLYWPYDAQQKDLPGLYVDKYSGTTLHTLAQQGKTATLVQTGATVQGYMKNIWGVLPGMSDEVILVTSHHDSPHKGAVEDGSGMAQLFAQIYAWTKVPLNQRPKTIVFVAAGGHMWKGQGATEFAKRNTTIMKKATILITLEHMGAKEVKEASEGTYIETGLPQISNIYVNPDADVIAKVWKALDAKPSPNTMCSPPPVGVLMTDGAGYVSWSKGWFSGYPIAGGLPYVSWISAPLYLVDEGDDLDKIDKKRLVPLAQTATEIVKNFMASPSTITKIYRPTHGVHAKNQTSYIIKGIVSPGTKEILKRARTISIFDCKGAVIQHTSNITNLLSTNNHCITGIGKVLILRAE